MSQPNGRPSLHSQVTNPYQEVLILADVVGNAVVTLAQVMNDFLELVPEPIIAGGFAMAHHGFVRATVDIDVLAMASTQELIKKFVARGYKHESVQIPIGALDLLTKGNKGVDFIHLKNDAFRGAIQKRAVTGTFAGVAIRFVAIEDLILLKMMATKGRKNKMDEADLEVLLAKPHNAAYVEAWKNKLVIK